jgi:hypothetical protein
VFLLFTAHRYCKMGNRIGMYRYSSQGLFVVTVSSKSEGRTFGGFVSCVSINEKSLGYRSCCI